MANRPSENLDRAISELTGRERRALIERLRRSIEEETPIVAEPFAGDRSRPLPLDDLNQRLLASGLVTRLPDPTLDIDDDWEGLPAPIEGELLSETIVRERR